tara:strand:- start:4948 stop:5118 length:171 start_codon:yes stop_codon:yes gene_type:complete
MSDTDHPELVEFEGETLGDTITNLITEIIQLREKNEMLHSRCMHLEGLLEEWRDTE